MEINLAKQKDIVILELNGRLDTNTATLLEEKLFSLIDNNEKKILVDFEKLEFISSSGLRVFLMAEKKLKSTNGEMVLGSLKDNIKEVFDIVGFDSIFTFIPSREEAISRFE